MVVAHHARNPAPWLFNPLENYNALAWGVDIFFAISGFLITSLLRHERDTTGAIRLGAFWGRRFRRLRVRPHVEVPAGVRRHPVRRRPRMASRRDTQAEPLRPQPGGGWRWRTSGLSCS